MRNCEGSAVIRRLIPWVLVLVTTPIAAAQSSSPVLVTEIPLREGLTTVAAYHKDQGDFELIKTVTKVDARAVTVTLSTDEPTACPRKLLHRAVLHEDLERAHALRPEFNACASDPEPELISGSTAISVSASVLRELKAQGQTTLSSLWRMAAGNVMIAGVLTPVQRESVPFPVILNDERVEVAAIHARWHSSAGDREYWILDNGGNPLVLRAASNGKVVMTIVKLSFPTDETAARLERDLSREGRAVLYGIYFDFASDRIKEESEPGLKEIADVITKHPTWRLTLEGHTDNIGSDEANLLLSQRRAAAVHKALGDRYMIAPTRLQPAGFGETRPKATNKSLEGRALNRRVELARIGDVEERRVQERVQFSSPVLVTQIPLREGLTIVAAHNKRAGDFEPILTVTKVDAEAVTYTLSTDEPPKINCTAQGDRLGNHRQVVRRSILREDLKRAHGYYQGFTECVPQPEPSPRKTGFSVSASVLQELKANGRTDFAFAWSREYTVNGVLTRIEPQSVPFTVILNDERVEVAAIHARWHSSEVDRKYWQEYWVLDDVDNPLVLHGSQNGKPFWGVIKLSFPTDETAARLERDLSREGRAVLYGIYFDFASDRIRDESNAVLEDIAKMLRQNPGWSLAIEGHTDNLGGDAYNLDLAKRRAAAVKETLVARYKLEGKRLHPTGFGAAKPKDTNDTLEGRARNRRVELARIDR